MLVRRRIGLLAAGGSLLVAAAAGASIPATAARPVAPRGPILVQVEGTLVVAQQDGPGARRTYAIAMAGGELLRVRGQLAHARPLSHFVGRVVLPGAVRGALASRGLPELDGSTLMASSATGHAALRLVQRQSLALRVAGVPRLTPPEQRAAPTTHQQYVAAMDNEGSLGQTDAQLLAHVSAVGAYWKHEANGAISRIDVPASATHYDTALTTTDCGLGSDFFSVVQEAAKQFPGLDVFGGPAQLVVFVPPGCQSGGIVGEGTVGSSFASGGALVVKAGTAIEGTYAHETGHNYGFAHSNARRSGLSMEYYGAYDVMGFALSGVNQLTALSTPFRVFQGVTDPGEIQRVDLGDEQTPVRVATTISPRSDDAGSRSVRVVDPDTGEPLYLDYRSGTGQDAGAFYAKRGALGATGGALHYAPGVTVTAARAGGGVDTLVVDGSGDTSLAAGTTWTNASGTLRVAVTSTSPTGAAITIRYRPHLARLTAGRPTITGRPVVGRRLTAVAGAWTAGTSFTYVWLANGRAIPHQSSRRLVLTRAEKGERIRVRVTGTKIGYHARARASAQTTKVS